jgi:hypothetical protein
MTNDECLMGKFGHRGGIGQEQDGQVSPWGVAILVGSAGRAGGRRGAAEGERIERLGCPPQLKNCTAGAEVAIMGTRGEIHIWSICLT